MEVGWQWLAWGESPVGGCDDAAAVSDERGRLPDSGERRRDESPDLAQVDVCGGDADEIAAGVGGDGDGDDVGVCAAFVEVGVRQPHRARADGDGEPVEGAVVVEVCASGVEVDVEMAQPGGVLHPPAHVQLPVGEQPGHDRHRHAAKHPAQPAQVRLHRLIQHRQILCAKLASGCAAQVERSHEPRGVLSWRVEHRSQGGDGRFQRCGNAVGVCCVDRAAAQRVGGLLDVAGALGQEHGRVHGRGPVQFHLTSGIWNIPVNLDFMARLFVIAAGSWSFLIVRGVENAGYDFTVSIVTLRDALVSLAGFTIALPLGFAMRFIAWNPQYRGLPQFLADYVTIFLFVAIAEELFFRGILQNLLEGSLGSRPGSRNIAQAIVSALFGLSHVQHAPAPNWRYVALATVAGWFYGLAYRKRRSLMASAGTHAMVDTLWRTLLTR